MDESTIASGKNFRRGIERIETNSPIKDSNYQRAIHPYSASINQIQNSEDIIILILKEYIK